MSIATRHESAAYELRPYKSLDNDDADERIEAVRAEHGARGC